MRAPGARFVSISALLACLTGCSLISIKSPERPLSTRDLNARILTREYSADFNAAVEQCANDIVANSKEAGVAENALRWKIAAVGESQRAATRMAPMMSLLDTWALAAQMQAFLAEGNAGGALFGAHQGAARGVANKLADDAEALVRRLVAGAEFEGYQKFVVAYTRDHPIEDLAFARASVVTLWSRESGAEVRLVDSLGTIPEATADLTQQLQMYGDTVPSQAMWRTELTLREAGYSGTDVRAALQQLDTRLAALSRAADKAPQLVHGAVGDVRESVVEVINRLNVAVAAMAAAVQAERIALSESVRTERQAIAGIVDAQRQALTLDATKLADQVVRTSGEQVRLLARELMLWLVVLAVFVLGLPFAAGYLVGRTRGARAP